MADQIPYSIAKNLLIKLTSAAFQEIRLMHGVRDQLRKLNDKLSTVRAVLLDAEEPQETSHAVRLWVGRLKDVVYDADDLLDDFVAVDLRRKTDDRPRCVREVSDFLSSSNHLVFHSEIGHRIKEIMERLDGITNDMKNFKFLAKQTSEVRVRDRRRETCSVVERSHKIVGRDEDKKKLTELLMQSSSRENLSTVVITGIGGLGKTTLAQLVYNDQRVVDYFHLKMWVCVSDDFNVKTLIKNVIKSATNNDVENLELDQLQDPLKENLDGKRYLLVLDDVWNEDEKTWGQFIARLPAGASGSKILVTTRSDKVALAAGIDSPYVVEGLKEDESWDLFQSLAFRNGEEKTRPDLKAIGKDIAKTCGGVPLVIMTLSSMLRFKTQQSQWLSIKNNENLLLLKEGNNILSVLRLSYDNLPTHLKQCFVYCALFPKDYRIEKKLLVQLWMAQGYLEGSTKKMELEEIGNHYFKDLVSRSLFVELEKDEDNNDILSCKMHDLIHDLAQSVGKSEVIILMDDVKIIPETVHHISSFRNSNERAKDLLGKFIRTLFIDDENPYGVNNDDWPFSNFQYLRAMKVCFRQQKVPTNWTKLSHLRFLDLSGGLFEKLPNGITRLKHLQTLKLLGCEEFKEWPKDMKKLINLRHLEIDAGCIGSLTYMPRGLGELTKLLTLPIYMVGKDSGERRHRKMGGGLSELKSLNNLRGRLHILWHSDRMRGGIKAKEAILEGKEYLDSLGLVWEEGEESSEEVVSIMESLKPHRNLKELIIGNYRGERFPDWMMNDGLGLLLPNLVTIEMEFCNRIQVLPPFGQLPSLKTLVLMGFIVVESMKDFPSSSSTSSSGKPFFPCLNLLTLGGSRNLICLPEGLRHASSLQTLEIQDCSALTTLPHWIGDLTSLAQLGIFRCPKLASLPQEMRSLRHLRRLIIYHCPDLTPRCRKEMGDDWPLISHIPQIDVEV